MAGRCKIEFPKAYYCLKRYWATTHSKLIPAQNKQQCNIALLNGGMKNDPFLEWMPGEHWRRDEPGIKAGDERPTFAHEIVNQD